jgi:hydrogenase maturation factor HypF (carbamoyltransferase family)
VTDGPFPLLGMILSGLLKGKIVSDDRSAMAAMRCCVPCKSYHVDPKNKAHWKALRCFRRWSTWVSIKQKEKEINRLLLKVEQLREGQS